MLKVEKAIKTYRRVTNLNFKLTELNVVRAENVLFEIYR